MRIHWEIRAWSIVWTLKENKSLFYSHISVLSYLRTLVLSYFRTVVKNSHYIEWSQRTSRWDNFSKLKAWCDHLSEVARIEFEDDAQYLEKLGFLVRSWWNHHTELTGSAKLYHHVDPVAFCVYDNIFCFHFFRRFWLLPSTTLTWMIPTAAFAANKIYFNLI